MAFKQRNKISPDFSMASLTDVIFLLLIFFMLNANMSGSAASFELPVSDARTVAPTSLTVIIRQNGEMQVNRQSTVLSDLQTALQQALNAIPAEDRPEVAVSIVAEVGTSFDNVADVMSVANVLGLRAIIATQPRR